MLTALWRKMESPILSLYEGNFHPLYHLQMFQGAGAGFSSDPDIYSVAFSYPDGQQLSFIHPPFVMLASKILGVGRVERLTALSPLAPRSCPTSSRRS